MLLDISRILKPTTLGIMSQQVRCITTRMASLKVSENQRARMSRAYARLPRVEPTTDVCELELCMDALFSGYRPLAVDALRGTAKLGRTNDSIDAKHVSSLQYIAPNTIHHTEDGTLYEISIGVEPLKAPWATSATGIESYDEWSRVPRHLWRGLKPYHPPPPATTLLKNQQNKHQPQRGRRKPAFSWIRKNR